MDRCYGRTTSERTINGAYSHPADRTTASRNGLNRVQVSVPATTFVSLVPSTATHPPSVSTAVGPKV